MLYTIVAELRKEQYVFQIRAMSPTDAIKAWAEALDVGKIRNFGALSKSRLLQRLKSEGVNAVSDLPGVYTWYGGLGGFHSAIVLVETAEA